MVLRAQDGQLRQRFAQDARENRADGVFRLKVSRVEEVQAAVLRFLKVIVFEIRGHERVAARGEDFVDRAAAAAAADGDTAHGPACVGKPEAGSAERRSYERGERREALRLYHPGADEAVGAALRVLPDGVQDGDVREAERFGQHVVDAAGTDVEIRM